MEKERKSLNRYDYDLSIRRDHGMGGEERLSSLISQRSNVAYKIFHELREHADHHGRRWSEEEEEEGGFVFGCCFYY